LPLPGRVGVGAGSYTIQAQMPDVQNLKENSRVQFNDVLVGNVAKARGKVVFLLDQRKIESVYLDGHDALRGRLAFTNATPGAPDAAFTECNECGADEINALVRRGYLVRARADDPAQGQGVRNDGTRRDVVLSSGAQMISTDYPVHEPSEHGYAVGLPGDVAVHCNPVLTTAAQCKDAGLETTQKGSK